MQLKMIEVSLSKEERRIIDEFGNTASTWARIGITAELEEGDLPECCIALLKEEIQPQVDDWLLRQGGYVTPPPSAAEYQEMLEETFGDVAVITETEWPVDEVARRGQAIDEAASPEAGDDEIPE